MGLCPITCCSSRVIVSGCTTMPMSLPFLSPSRSQILRQAHGEGMSRSRGSGWHSACREMGGCWGAEPALPCPPLGGADLPWPLRGAAEEDPGSAAAAGRRAGPGAGAGAGGRGDGALGRVASTWDSAGHLTRPVPPVLARPEHRCPRPFPRTPGPGRASCCGASRRALCRACGTIGEPWLRR